MYEAKTYEALLQRMLDRVPNDVDKREGSLIFNALAPAAAELAQMYIELDINMNLSFADTATGEELSRRTAEFGVERRRASRAVRQGEFFAAGGVPLDVPLQSRFSMDGLNYVVEQKIADGKYRLLCEQPGSIGNAMFGTLLPIQHIDGLVRAELTEVLVPGEDEETDEELRLRYYEAVNEPAFGGNVADYKRKINEMDGVGDVKVYPAWNGGGTVKCTVIAADLRAPSPSLIDELQTAIDPTVNRGEGIGLAPIGHQVTISGVSEVVVEVETTLTLQAEVVPSQIQRQLEAAIEQYLLSLRQTWAKESGLIVRLALIESAALTVPGVIDVANTTLNGAPANLTLGSDEIPILGSVLINA